MGKVLSKSVRTKPNKSYKKNIAKIAKITISVKSIIAPSIEIYSVKELKEKKIKNENKSVDNLKDFTTGKL